MLDNKSERGRGTQIEIKDMYRSSVSGVIEID